MDSTAAFDTAGIMSLLSADDSLDTASDLMEVRVGAACAAGSR